jgi:hypothetical protein
MIPRYRVCNARPDYTRVFLSKLLEPLFISLSRAAAARRTRAAAAAAAAAAAPRRAARRHAAICHRGVRMVAARGARTRAAQLLLAAPPSHDPLINKVSTLAGTAGYGRSSQLLHCSVRQGVLPQQQLAIILL